MKNKTFILFFLCTIVFCSMLCTGTSNYDGVYTCSESPISSPHENGTSSTPSHPFPQGNFNKAEPLGSSTSDSTTARTDQTWCVARSDVPQQKLQEALSHACGIRGVDCAPIQKDGTCFQPDNLVSHASYVFNDCYQKMGMLPGTCDFYGTALTTPTDPSYGSCQYPTSGGLSLANSATSGISSTRSPYTPSMAHFILITMASLLLAVLMLSHL